MKLRIRQFDTVRCFKENENLNLQCLNIVSLNLHRIHLLWESLLSFLSEELSTWRDRITQGWNVVDQLQRWNKDAKRVWELRKKDVWSTNTQSRLMSMRKAQLSRVHTKVSPRIWVVIFLIYKCSVNEGQVFPHWKLKGEQRESWSKMFKWNAGW